MQVITCVLFVQVALRVFCLCTWDHRCFVGAISITCVLFFQVLPCTCVTSVRWNNVSAVDYITVELFCLCIGGFKCVSSVLVVSHAFLLWRWNNVCFLCAGGITCASSTATIKRLSAPTWTVCSTT